MSYRLKVAISQYWHCGAGRGGGAVIDAKVQRDATGLPYVPGRHLRGLVRAACECAQEWTWPDCDASLAAHLFGDRTEGAGDRMPQPGCLRVADATLPDGEAAWLAHSSDGRALITGLFRNLHVTAIDQATGSAKGPNLRGIEVTVPLTLYADVELLDGRTPPAGWVEQLQRVLPLVTAVGAHRSRGLGRACVTLEEA